MRALRLKLKNALINLRDIDAVDRRPWGDHMKSRAGLFLGLACASWAAICVQSQGAFADGFQFPSRTLADRGGLFSGAPGTPITIRGSVDLPSGAQGRVPAVIIGHASDGVTPDVQEVAKAARAAGFAALYYDSLSVRGGSSTRSGGAAQVQINQAADALAAFKALAADPRIDAKKIAYVGMSMGGGAAVVVASTKLQTAELGDKRFAAHVAFYPGLHQAPPVHDLSGAPILILQGDQDDYQNPARPRAYIEYVKKTAPDYPIAMEMIPNAQHGFLSPNLSAKRYVGDYVNGSLCPILLLDPGRRVTLNVQGQVSESFECKPSRGASVGYSRAGSEAGLSKAMTFLKTRFAAL